jgi:hypothetical protein
VHVVQQRPDDGQRGDLGHQAVVHHEHLDVGGAELLERRAERGRLPLRDDAVLTAEDDRLRRRVGQRPEAGAVVGLGVGAVVRHLVGPDHETARGVERRPDLQDVDRVGRVRAEEGVRPGEPLLVIGEQLPLHEPDGELVGQGVALRDQPPIRAHQVAPHDVVDGRHEVRCRRRLVDQRHERLRTMRALVRSRCSRPSRAVPCSAR